MKKLITVTAILLLSLNNFGLSEVTRFNKCKLADAKGKRTAKKTAGSNVVGND